MSERQVSKASFLVAVPQPDGAPDKVTVSLTDTPQVLLALVVNRMNALRSKELQEACGLGVMDFRMLVMLTLEPGATVAVASKTIGVDKGAVSRSLSMLERSGLVTSVSNKRDQRSKEWTLTKEGHALHEMSLQISLDFQEKLLEGLSPKEVDQLIHSLRRLLSNLDRMIES